MWELLGILFIQIVAFIAVFGIYGYLNKDKIEKEIESKIRKPTQLTQEEYDKFSKISEENDWYA